MDINNFINYIENKDFNRIRNSKSDAEARRVLLELAQTEQLLQPDVSKSLPERKGRCCGRCDGVHDLCFSDMTCDAHEVLGCEDCYGKR